MSFKRFKEIRSKAHYIFADMEAKNNRNKWWPILEVEKSYAAKQRKFFKQENKE